MVLGLSDCAVLRGILRLGRVGKPLAALKNIPETRAILVDHRIRCPMASLLPRCRTLRGSPAGADVEGSFLAVRRALYYEKRFAHV